MATLIKYRGLQVLDPGPTGAGGLAIQNDLKVLVDRIAASRFVDGLAATWVSPAQLRIEPGATISADGSTLITLASASSISTGVSGAGGLDTGTVSPDSIYFAHVIADSDEVNPVSCLMSLSASSPTLPAGYDQSRRVGFVATDASSDVVAFNQAWNGLTRRYYYAADHPNLLVLTSGSATTFATIDLARFVPSTAKAVQLHAFIVPGSSPAPVLAGFRRLGDTHNGLIYPLVSFPGSPFEINAHIEVPVGANQSIEYFVSDAGSEVTVAVIGVDDEL